VINEHGWTKEAMDKAVKLDSFLKESQRLMGVDHRERFEIFTL
jgi:hypothetical protein